MLEEEGGCTDYRVCVQYGSRAGKSDTGYAFMRCTVEVCKGGRRCLVMEGVFGVWFDPC